MISKNESLLIRDIQKDFPEIINEEIIEIRYERINYSYLPYQLITDKAKYIKKSLYNCIGNIQEESLTMAFNNVLDFSVYKKVLLKKINFNMFLSLSNHNFKFIEFPKILGNSKKFVKLKFYSDAKPIDDINKIIHNYKNIITELVNFGFYITLTKSTNFLQLSNNKLLYVDYDSIVDLFRSDFRILLPYVFINGVGYTQYQIYYWNPKILDYILSFRSILTQLSGGQVELKDISNSI